METKSTASPSANEDRPAPLRIGVLIVEPVQLLDLSAIDLFGMLTREYLQACQLPTSIVNLGIPVEIHYISTTPFLIQPSSASAPGPTTSTPFLAPLTASASLLLTTDMLSPLVSPASLDIILIPGPDPSARIPPAVSSFLHLHYAKGAVLMSVCTGIFVLVASGVLLLTDQEDQEGDGSDAKPPRMATGPRALLPELRRTCKGVAWVEKRWCSDGRVWSSGGITNGLDMVAAFLREKYPGPLSDTVCALADVGGRGQEYETGNTRETLWWLWAILRAWLKGVWIE